MYSLSLTSPVRTPFVTKNLVWPLPSTSPGRWEHPEALWWINPSCQLPAHQEAILSLHPRWALAAALALPFPFGCGWRSPPFGDPRNPFATGCQRLEAAPAKESPPSGHRMVSHEEAGAQDWPTPALLLLAGAPRPLRSLHVPVGDDTAWQLFPHIPGFPDSTEGPGLGLPPSLPPPSPPPPRTCRPDAGGLLCTSGLAPGDGHGRGETPVALVAKCCVQGGARSHFCKCWHTEQVSAVS